MLKDESIVVCTNIVKNDTNSLIIVGRKFTYSRTPFKKPYIATDHHIYGTSNLSVEEHSWPIKEIKAKCYAFPLRPTKKPDIFDSAQKDWFMSPPLHTLI